LLLVEDVNGCSTSLENVSVVKRAQLPGKGLMKSDEKLWQTIKFRYWVGKSSCNWIAEVKKE
jgi:hypothetical protein